MPDGTMYTGQGNMYRIRMHSHAYTRMQPHAPACTQDKGFAALPLGVWRGSLPGAAPFQNRSLPGAPRPLYAHSRGVFTTASNSASREPGSGWWSYNHPAVNGRLMRISSTRLPGVFKPNCVPRSYTRLNST